MATAAPALRTTVTMPEWIGRQVALVVASQHAHALLLQGMPGTGQQEMALALAKAWLCEADLASRPAGLACGYCGSCRLVDQRSHPDLRLVVPEASRIEAGFSPDEAPAATAESKKRKPSREIKVDQIREALNFSELTASRGNLKVLVVHPAEAMNDIAANTLLKTLEEPPGAMRFILATSAPHLLLPTIRSRCQVVPVEVPPRDEALQWLAEHGVDKQAAAVLLDVSGGQPLSALAHARAQRTADIWQRFHQCVVRQDAALLSDWPLAVLIDALQRLCHDAMRLAVGAPPHFFRDPGFPKSKASLAELTVWAKELQMMSRQAEHPWNLPLSIEAILQRSATTLMP